MSESLYVSCAEVLSVCQPLKDDLRNILDPDTGFAPRMRQICQDQIADLEDRPESQSFREEIEFLRLEQNSWALLQAIMPERKLEPLEVKTPKELLTENPYLPTATLAQSIMDNSKLLSELVVVKDWLHETAPAPSPPEANTGYWKFTKHTLMQSLRTSVPQREGLVTEMDPDAVNRKPGTSLAADDASYEKSLLQALYGYIRAGRLEDAVEVCRRANQPWRAASLRGSLLFQWKAMSTAYRDDDQEDDPDAERWSGNQQRKLWKATCIRAALSPSLSDHERVLFAAIAPSPQTISILKGACRTWEDHLWADISVLCEEKESKELSNLGGCFWEGGVDAVDKGPQELSRQEQETVEEEWQMEVLETLYNLKSVAVAEGPPADHALHFSQLYIILNQTDSLLNVFANGLQDGTYPHDSFEYGSMCRFFAHLCLFLQMIDIPVPPLSTQVILESYLAVLEEAGQRDLIAMYAGALGDNAVERYAMFLVSLALSANVQERRLTLTRASEHGLDVERVAIAAAERTIDKALRDLPTLKDPLPSLLTLPSPPTDAEMLLLRSIEWTTFMEVTYRTALEQANVIMRYFLCTGRIQLAQALLDMLPAELATIAEPEEDATEYLHYRQFFVIWQTLDRVVDCQAQDVPGMTREAKAAWSSNYRKLIDQVYDQIMRLLMTEWLVSDTDDIPRANKRRRELVRIRQIYIPELILRLHSILYSSRKVISENLKRTLELANVVADSRYKLYEDFMNEGGRSLVDYLGAIRQAVLGGLENGGSDPFRIVASA